MKRRVSRYRIFISHSYAYSDEYRRLVAMLDRVAEQDRTWQWENLSVPHGLPLLTDEEATQGETYIRRMAEQKAQAHVVILILRREAIDSESVFLEAFEAMPQARPVVPVIGLLPRGANLEDWSDHWGVTTVKWHPKSIVRAIKRFASPAQREELVLNADEETERERIFEALKANCWKRAQTATALGFSRSTLWKKMRRYIISEDQFGRRALTK